MKIKFYDGDVVTVGNDELSYVGRCAFCRWFSPVHVRSNYDNFCDDDGHCQRYPPVVVGGSLSPEEAYCMDSVRFMQPVVVGGDWCGEYKDGFEDLSSTEATVKNGIR